MAFFETEFPRNLAFKSQGGPGFSTIVNQGFSGQEFRNRNWAFARAEYTIDLLTPIGFQGNPQGYIDALLDFFFVVGGQADGFRLLDPMDHIATNQALATVDGHVQLVKNYVVGGRTYQRVITKPITSAVTDYLGNALDNTVFLAGTGTAVTVDPTTGIVTGHSAGTAVDFQFHVPVRFATDLLPLQGEDSNFKNGQGIIRVNSCKLIEVLPPNY
ncbi:MAG TPA: DUF2460 domain-containing protein [Chloroflexota bacterium]|nr:DUF2460 domain-containing protein [Chloroflexota bacterium]